MPKAVPRAGPRHVAPRPMASRPMGSRPLGSRPLVSRPMAPRPVTSQPLAFKQASKFHSRIQSKPPIILDRNAFAPKPPIKLPPQKLQETSPLFQLLNNTVLDVTLQKGPVPVKYHFIAWLNGELAKFISDPKLLIPLYLLPTNVLQWSIDDVRQFMVSIGYPRLADSFYDQEIDGQALMMLKKTDIQGQGLKPTSARKLLLLITRLHHDLEQVFGHD